MTGSPPIMLFFSVATCFTWKQRGRRLPLEGPRLCCGLEAQLRRLGRLSGRLFSLGPAPQPAQCCRCQGGSVGSRGVKTGLFSQWAGVGVVSWCGHFDGNVPRSTLGFSSQLLELSEPCLVVTQRHVGLRAEQVCL